MLLPDPLDPTSAVVDPAGALNDTCFKTGTPRVYSKVMCSNSTSPRMSVSGARLLVFLILRGHAPNLADAIEACKRLGQLRPDRCQLENRHCHQSGEREIHHQIAHRHGAVANRRSPISIIAMPRT